jgi:RNA polymerase sigma-70 factor (ECF subfamily)
MNATACYFVNSMAEENIEIARGLRGRNPELLDRLIEKYQHRLLRYLISLTGRRELADDFFQETWVRVLERGRQYDGRHEFSTWLFTIARNLVFDQMRRKRPLSLDSLTDRNDSPEASASFDIPASGQASAFDATVQREQNEQISAGMQHIASEYRETLVLRFQEGMSLEEIASVTGAPLGTVKSRIYRGLTALEPWVKGARL